VRNQAEAWLAYDLFLSDERISTMANWNPSCAP